MTERRRDDFNAQREAWLLQIAGDPGIPGLPARIAMVLAVEFMNRKTRQAWPSHKTLAKLTGSAERAVKKAIDRLTERGHLRLVSAGGGRRKTNRYTWQILVVKGELQDRVNGSKTVSKTVGEKGSYEAKKTGPAGHPNLMKESIEGGARGARPITAGPPLVESLYASVPVSSQSTKTSGEGSALEASLPPPADRTSRLVKTGEKEEVGERPEVPSPIPAADMFSKSHDDAGAINCRLDELWALIRRSAALPPWSGKPAINRELAHVILEEATAFGMDIKELRQLVESAVELSKWGLLCNAGILQCVKRYMAAIEQSNDLLYEHPDGLDGMLETVFYIDMAADHDAKDEINPDDEQFECGDYAYAPF